jgi:hypothetical protein
MSHDDGRLPEGGVVVGKGKPHMMHLFTCKPGETGYTGSRFRSRLETHWRLLPVPLANGSGREGPLSFTLGLSVTVNQFPIGDGGVLQAVHAFLETRTHGEDEQL